MDENGSDIMLHLEGDNDSGSTQITLELKEKTKSFTFKNVNYTPIVSINRGFTSPVKTNVQHSNDELSFLFSHDSDEFNRWDAGQSLAINTLLNLVQAIKDNQPLLIPDNVINSYKIP